MPPGRILNRFAKDTGYMDELLPPTLTDFLQVRNYNKKEKSMLSDINAIILKGHSALDGASWSQKSI